ncbi:glycosyl transferase family 4 [Candidatus Pacearchaeota archaeon]|nr:glycosyl transferase family 4 [Candidatus Pacearchaeota archaeon]
MKIILLISLAISFFTTFFLLPSWISRAKKAGLSGKDMNKIEQPEAAESGGIMVITGFILGVLYYIAIKTFYLNSMENIIEIFALLAVIVLATLIGLIDDIFGWKIGLNKKTRIFFLLLLAVPLSVINAGESIVSIPFVGQIDLGLLFPLLIIPIGVLGSTITYNFLAGYNGLEARQGILILFALSIVTYYLGETWIALISLIMASSLIAFIFYNKYPAKVFPGNTMTYAVGSLIAIIAIIGNIEKIAVFFFIPYIIETILKLRGKLKVESFARVNDDNSLEMPSDKIYGLEHAAIKIIKKIKGKCYEKNVVNVINIFQIAIIILGFIIFRNNIF